MASGSLFNYFPTKADLLNALYLELKAEMAFVALDGLPPGDDVRQQVLHMWSHWLHWAASYPERRKTLNLSRLVCRYQRGEPSDRESGARGHRQAIGTKPRKRADAECSLGVRHGVGARDGRRDDRLHDLRSGQRGHALRRGVRCGVANDCLNSTTAMEFARETPRLRFSAVEPGFNPGTSLGHRDVNVFVRFLAKYVIARSRLSSRAEAPRRGAGVSSPKS